MRTAPSRERRDFLQGWMDRFVAWVRLRGA